MARGCLPLFIFLLLLILLPFFLADAMLTALSKLGLTSYQSLMAAIGIFAGGMINIPIRKFDIDTEWEQYQTLFGFKKFDFSVANNRKQMTLAINVGGGLIPSFLAFYQLYRFGFLYQDYVVFTAMLAAVAINVAVCYKLARPIKNVGITLNAFIPAIVAALTAIFLAPEHAPVIAFVAGVSGPLIGADLMHLGDIKRISTGMASIGGAGTFDGIVLSGIVATLLA